MQPARPLRDVLTDLVGDGDAAGPSEVLAAGGHSGLPDQLVAEAVGTFADTAPIEVAEHLSPYVMANSAVPLPDAPEVDAGSWLDAFSGAPVPDADPAALLDGGFDGAPATWYEPTGTDVGDLAFGHGGHPDPHVSTVDDGHDVGDIQWAHDDHATPDPSGLDDLPVADTHVPLHLDPSTLDIDGSDGDDGDDIDDA
jgi:hypothetical protein